MYDIKYVDNSCNKKVGEYFGQDHVEKLFAATDKLPQNEQLDALKTLNCRFGYARNVANYVKNPDEYRLPKGMKEITGVSFKYSSYAALWGKDGVGHTYPKLDYDLLLLAIQSMAK